MDRIERLIANRDSLPALANRLWQCNRLEYLLTGKNKF
jgi:hypothetical protein